MGKEIFNEAKKQIITSGLEIEDSKYIDATNNWYIVLETVKKIRIAWDSANNYLTIEEKTIDTDSGLIVWQYLFASRLTSQHEILSTLDSLLKNK